MNIYEPSDHGFLGGFTHPPTLFFHFWNKIKIWKQFFYSRRPLVSPKILTNTFYIFLCKKNRKLSGILIPDSFRNFLQRKI